MATLYVEITKGAAEAAVRVTGKPVMLQLEIWTGKTTTWVYDNIAAAFPELNDKGNWPLPDATKWAQDNAINLLTDPLQQVVLRAAWYYFVPQETAHEYDIELMSAGISVFA